MARTNNFGDVIRQKLAKDSDLAKRVENAAFDACIASQIHEARKVARLTQKQLAELVGTTQSVIARLEDADYDGHSLKLLQRVGESLGCRVRIEFYRKATQPSCDRGLLTVSDEVQWPSQVCVFEATAPGNFAEIAAQSKELP